MAEISEEELRKDIAAILQGSSSSASQSSQQKEKVEVSPESRKQDIADLVLDLGDSTVGNEKNVNESPKPDKEEHAVDTKKRKRVASASKKPPVKRIKKDSDEEYISEPSDGYSDDEYSPKKPKSTKPRRSLKSRKKSESDSDDDWGKTLGKKVGSSKKGAAGKKGSTGYTKIMNLSPALAELVGQQTMSRQDVIKKIRTIIKEKNLSDPKNKQYAICDEALLKVIGAKRFRTFGMMKYLKNHFS